MHAFSINTVDTFSIFSVLHVGYSSMEIRVADWCVRRIDWNWVPDHGLFGDKTHTERRQQPNPYMNVIETKPRL